MSKKLVIVESPHKSKTIEKYLGKDFKVVSSVGHIRDLSTSGKYGFGVDIDNNFKPDYKIIKGKAKLVKELREKTGAGMMDCKKALSATDGDMDKAIDFLREKGLASAAKKAGRVAAEGVVTSYIHAGGRIGVLVEVNCETDFVAGTPEFQDFARDIAMQIAAANPTCVRREEVDPAAIEHERQVLREQAINEGKPEKIVERMVEGRLEKYYKEVCLLDQPYIKDPDVTISDLVKGKIAKIGENISIRRFVRYQLGEGIEKKADNFVEEVMAAVK